MEQSFISQVEIRRCNEHIDLLGLEQYMKNDAIQEKMTPKESALITRHLKASNEPLLDLRIDTENKMTM